MFTTSSIAPRRQQQQQQPTGPGSYITLKDPSANTIEGAQNYAAYAAAVEALTAFDAEVEALRTRIAASFQNSTVILRVNHCSAYWEPGTVPNYSLALQLRRGDGSNIYSHVGGGSTPEQTLVKIANAFDDFCAQKMGEVFAPITGHTSADLFFLKPFRKED